MDRILFALKTMKANHEFMREIDKIQTENDRNIARSKKWAVIIILSWLFLVASIVLVGIIAMKGLGG